MMITVIWYMPLWCPDQPPAPQRAERTASAPWRVPPYSQHKPLGVVLEGRFYPGGMVSTMERSTGKQVWLQPTQGWPQVLTTDYQPQPDKKRLRGKRSVVSGKPMSSRDQASVSGRKGPLRLFLRAELSWAGLAGSGLPKLGILLPVRIFFLKDCWWNELSMCLMRPNLSLKDWTLPKPNEACLSLKDWTLP